MRYKGVDSQVIRLNVSGSASFGAVEKELARKERLQESVQYLTGQ